MPNIKSQKKRVLTSQKRAEAVKSERTKIKGAIKKVRLAVEEKNVDLAKESLTKAYSLLDASISKGIHNKNYVTRIKSRLAKSVSLLG